MAKSIKRNFLETSPYPLKTGQNLHPWGQPVRNNGPLKNLKSYVFW